MLKIILFFAFCSAMLCAQEPCELKKDCGKSKPSLEEALKPKTTSSIKKEPLTQIGKEEVKTSLSKETLNTEKTKSGETEEIREQSKSEEKPVFEKPGYTLLWLVILAGLYFYLRKIGKKKKR